MAESVIHEVAIPESPASNGSVCIILNLGCFFSMNDLINSAVCDALAFMEKENIGSASAIVWPASVG